MSGGPRRAEPGGPAPGDGTGASRWPRRAWWIVAGVILAGVAATAVVRRREVSGAFGLLARADPLPLVAAAGCEAASLLCFAAVWRWLLSAGGARWPLRRVMGLTLGAGAVAGILPGGAVFAAAWAYRQMRRRAVDPALAAAVLAVAGALSAAAIGVLGLTALLAAAPSSRAVLLRPLLVLVGLLALAAGAVAVLSRSAAVRRTARRLWTAAGRRHERVHSVQDALRRVSEQAWNLRPGLRPWLLPAAEAFGNWALDLACLTLCMRALHVAVPWPGILVVYVLTQVPAALRLTPGNLGVLEVGLAALLAAYGLPARQALAAALLYRALSFWALQPPGWVCWVAVTLHGRRR